MDALAIKSAAALLGSAITIFSYIPYYLSLFRREIKPHMFSWIIWGLSAAIACAAQIYEGGGYGAAVAGCAAVLSFSVAVFAFSRGEKNITHTDWAFFIAALCAIPLWLLTNEPLLAALLVTLVDILGFGPTIRKSWNSPHNENALIFFLTGVQYILALVALQAYNLTTIIYPAGLVAVSFSFVMLLLYRRAILGKDVAHAA